MRKRTTEAVEAIKNFALGIDADGVTARACVARIKR